MTKLPTPRRTTPTFAEKLSAVTSRVDDILSDLNSVDRTLSELSEQKEQFPVDAERWLARQKTLGLITPEGAAAVERLIEDLR